MSPPTRVNQRLTTPLALAAAAIAVIVMAVWGMSSLTAPFEDDASSEVAAGCADAKAQRLTRGDVTVSVYNSGRRKGRAGATLDLLERAGFRPGAVGNAPKGVKTRIAVVRTTKRVHPDATLVARAFGPRVPVVVTADNLGPGVDVIIGDKFNRLNRKAPRSVRVPGTGDC